MDRLLLERIQGGDEIAFKQLYNLYWNRVYHFATLYLSDSFECEDVTQVAFLKLWEKRASLSTEKDLDGLLFIIIRNLVFSKHRRSLNERAVKKTLLEAGVIDDSVEAAIDAKDLADYVDILASNLPPRQRQAFLLSRRDGLSNKEIASVMNISVKGVERNIDLALKFIRRNLPLLMIFLDWNV